MGLRSKSRARILLLTGGILGVVVLLGTAYGFRKWQISQSNAQLKPKGLAAYQKGEIVEALHLLGPYLQLHSEDAEALEVYAKVREKLPEHKQQHLWEAIQLYRRLIALRPYEMEHKLTLLRLYVRVGMQTEAKTLAEEILAKDATSPVAVETLELQGQSLIALRKFGATGTPPRAAGAPRETAMECAREALRIDPLALGPAEQLLAIMANNHESLEALLKQARMLIKGHESDPRADYLLAAAYAAGRSKPEAIVAIRKAAAATPPSVVFVKHTVEILERLELFPEAESLLSRAMVIFKDEGDFQDDYYRRLIFREQFATAADELAKPEAHADQRTILTSMRIIALCSLNRKTEAKPLMDVLKARGERWDFAALGWQTMLDLVYFREDRKDREIIDACNDASDRDPSNAFLQYFLGEAYSTSGDTNEAVLRWTNAAALAPSWSRPLAQLSNYYDGAGSPAEALRLAKAADLRLPNQKETMVAMALSWSGSLGLEGVGSPDDLLKLIAKIQKTFPNDERTQPLEVALLSRMERKPAAIARLKEIVAATKPPVEQTLLSLSLVSKRFGLGQEAYCMDFSEKAYGRTPGLISMRCRLLIDDGKVDQAKALMEQSRKEAKGNEDVWGVAWCNMLEMTKDPGAGAAWKQLQKTFPENKRVQWSVLDATSVRVDHPFVGEVLERLKVLNGDTGLTWRLEKARWLLEEAKSRESQDAAAALLFDTVRTSPGSAGARELLAMSYENQGNLPSAVQQLKVAADLDPASSRIKLSLARLMLKQGDTISAVQSLKAVGASQTSSDLQKLEAGQLLAQAGEVEVATQLLEKYQMLDSNGSTGLSLATLYWRRGLNDKAEALFEKLLEKPTAGTIAMAANFYVTRGNQPAAEKALALLDGLEQQHKLDPGVKNAIKGAYYAQRGMSKEAVDLLSNAVRESPDNGEVRRRLLATLLASKQIDEALKAAVDASRVLPGDDTCRALTRNVGDMKRILADDDARIFVIACLLFPSEAKAVPDVVNALAATLDKIPTDQAALLRPIADRNRESLPLQVLTIRKTMLAGQIDEALAISKRAMLTDPGSPLPSLYASICYAQQGKWEEALTAAKRWRAATSSTALDPDLMIAAAFIGLNRTQEAIDLLKPLVKDGTDDLSHHNMVNLLVSAKVQQANAQQGAAKAAAYEDAANFLWPLVLKERSWRDDWLMMAKANIDDSTEAKAWLTKLAGITTSDDLIGRVNLGLGWYALGKRLSDETAVREGFTVLQAAAAVKSDVAHSAQIALILGTVYEGEENDEQAERYYRQALSQDGSLHAASNNLAMVLDRHGGRLDEALSLAHKAVDAQPANPAYHDTLALILANNLQIDNALVEMKKAVDIDPLNAMWKVHLADVLISARKRVEAQTAMNEADSLHPDLLAWSAQEKKRYDRVKASLAKLRG